MKKILLLTLTFSIIFAKIIIVNKNNYNKCDIYSSYIHFSTIKEALSFAKNNDTIKICEGNYEEDNLKINHYNLKIEGIGDVLITNKNLNTKHNIFSICSYSNLTLSNLKIEQYSNNNSIICSNKNIRIINLKNLSMKSKGYGLYLKNNYGWGNINIENLEISSTYDAIHINSARNLNIYHSNIKADTNAINLNHIHHIYIYNNIIKSQQNALFINKSLGYIKIYKNEITANNTNIYLNTLSFSTKIYENNISNGKYGIELYTYSIGTNIIKNNILKDNNYGLKILSKGWWSGYTNVTNNCFYNKNNILNHNYVAFFTKNYYNDLNNKLIYTIPDIPKYDKNPLPYCPLNQNPSPINNTQFYVKEISRTDNNITTKIVNKNFSLEIYTNQPFKGTVCSTVIDKNGNTLSDWKKNYFNSQLSTSQTLQGNPNYKISSANKDARIKITWVENQNRNCPITNPNNSITSKDNFAIRPKKFEITNYPDKILASEEFNFIVKALDNENHITNNYNASSNIILEANQKDDCLIGTINKNINIINGIDNNAIANYSEVGEINITIKENKNNPFAYVDLDDTLENELLIEPSTISLTSYPYQIISDTNISNKIVYNDKNLSTHYAEINSSIYSLNKDGGITQNFDNQCFGYDINLSYIVKNNSNEHFKGMFDINHYEFNDSKFETLDENLTLSKYSFQNGKSTIKIKFNIYKNKRYPVSIVDLNFSKLITYDTKTSKQYNEPLNKTISFYYLSVLAPLIYANEKTTSDKIYILVYDKNKNHFKDEKLLNWFINTNYKENDIKLLGYTLNKKYDFNISNFNINLTKNDYYYKIEINNQKKYRTVFIHLNTPNYLWTSKYFDLNISENSYCNTHYCSEYHLKYKPGSIGVRSGNFQGSQINTSQQNNQNGIKVYR